MVGQHRDVVRPLAQRRQRHRRHVQPVIEVFAEPAFADGAGQVYVGGGDHPHVHLQRLARSHAGDLALLQHPQQLDLQLQAQLADLIQQQGAAFRRFEPALMGADGAGKGAFLVAEQLGFRQAFGQRAAVHRQKRLMAARAVVVQIARHHLFAGAGLADDQYGGVGRRQPVQHALKGDRRRVDQHRFVGGVRLWVMHGRLLR